ncbi:HAD-IIB family hydrolase [Mesomycoplasma hyorhinis]|uniref:HAD-IIB family hydrolase n=1 Tax=Mesomycoplasma hyorhinis TaxID=2100 RepID=UPI00035D0287|nr:HAD-IIB family hydrolase [Mesomycoplasma hyorhinis]QPC29499.1 HAD-IIB family hydrolase [Mesomycoplasma hyorhinis]
MKKIFVYDLDGTLLQHNNLINETTLAAIKKAHSLDHVNIIATGRGLKTTKVISDMYPYFDYLVSNNGTIIYDIAKQKSYLNGFIDSKTLQLLFDIALEYNCLSAISTPDDAFLFSPQKEYDWLSSQAQMDLKAYNLISYAQMKNLIDNNTSISQFAFRNSEATTKVIYNKLAVELKDKYKVTITNRIFVDINPLDVDKFNCIQFILNSNNWSFDNVVAFGDSSNDFLMIKNAKIGFAMKHATPDLVQVATKVIGDCNSDAIGQEILKLI